MPASVISVAVVDGQGLEGPAIAGMGEGFTIAVVVPCDDVHPFPVTVTKYVPLVAAVAFETLGFC
jgi:hypothetical protein